MGQSSNTNPNFSKNATWSNDTKLPVTDPPQKPVDFQLTIDLLYHNEEGNSITVVDEGDITNGILHTIRLQDGAKLNLYDSNLQLLDQPKF